MSNSKIILVTGGTDGIGLGTVKKLKALGHRVLVHGRSEEKLTKIKNELALETFEYDLSIPAEVKAFAKEVQAKHSKIDVLINNAGVFKTAHAVTADGYDIRFVVNTFAPYLLSYLLLPLIPNSGRILNLASAAQSPVDIKALLGQKTLSDFEAYAQSKLALIMITAHMANELKDGPTIIAVNPGSLLGTKMVQEGFNTSGNDINIGIDILKGLSLESQYNEKTGKYYDNDKQAFSVPLGGEVDLKKSSSLVNEINKIMGV